MGGSRPVSVSDRLAIAESARADCRAANGSRLARRWRTCCTSDWRMDFVRQSGWAARGLSFDMGNEREKPSHCTRRFCTFSPTHRTLSYRVCEGNCRTRTLLAPLSCGLGVPDWRRTDRLRAGRLVVDPAAPGCDDRSGHDKPVYASRSGSCHRGRTQPPTAVDGILHL